jgi:nucleotide-binding universal stress UspA family protein
MRLLICTDGSPLAQHAVNYGALWVKASGADVTLLGFASGANTERLVRTSIDHAQRLFTPRAEEVWHTGKAATVILEEAGTGRYDLIVMSSRGRRSWQRIAFGSVAARLARYSPIPVLIVKGGRRVVHKLLACTGGDVRGERAAHWAGQIARWFNAESTILHVMSQIPFSPNSRLEELEETAEQAIAQHTREGQHLARALELMQVQGVAARMLPKIRHGLVLEEIVAEVREGDYDLVVIGGHQAPDFSDNSSQIRDSLLEDVADQVIMAVDRPLLVIKGR